ncbi:MAG: phosphate ABC transporter permease subunit PstC [Bacteroidia bacterium]|nr:phosphate ABC transporter permease subunit PstC [Bacteroidia bacterium]MDW8015515.1 phosphate ABC transporter permease subunit PstC [Bacteroidia bacterium]
MRGRWGQRFLQAAALTTFLVLGGLTIFLFREGLPALSKTPFEGIVFAVHPDNPVSTLTAAQVRALVRQEKRWQDFNGPDTVLIPIYLANIERYVPPTASIQEIRLILDSLAEFPGILFALPPALLPSSVKQLRVEWEGWKEIFFSTQWSPTYEPVPAVGFLPLLVGSLWVSIIGLAVVVPLGLAMAIYVVEFLPKSFYYPIKILWELLAGLPSVVVGFWGLVVVVPWIQKVFRLTAGETALTAGILLGWMTLPLMASLVEEALRAIPRLLEESSYGLGATQWQTIWRLKLPYVFPSIATATLLSAGRILGETMVVLMVSGNSPLLHFSPLQPVRTLPATLAAELGEAPVGSYHYHVLFLLGVILFILTLGLNLSAYLIHPKDAQAAR